ncbi:MAG: hypothetical protein HLUCCA11_19300 [Phormidesmis priestleyi Ana]|uniref:Cyanoexosortase A system-associated protein n=1 Tax=Phormidesmis priestleyi Ana TaxID=1666911 RepID=A0A0N8KMA9_9CYAN|nr:MAG: hypothetical protein HLUCCA11_19300 [Phormidesmis priestleyi Ana]
MTKSQFYLPFIFAGLFLTIIKLLIAPPTAKKYTPPEFPQSLEAAQEVYYYSDLISTEARAKSPILQDHDPQLKYHRVIARQQYHSRLEYTSPIEIILTYVVRTDGDWHIFLKSANFASPTVPKETLDRVTDKGVYRLWQQEGKTHLYSCINTRGTASVTVSQFRHEQYYSALQLPHLAYWLLGQRSLMEDSCLWIHLISRTKYLSLSEAAEEIEPIWLDVVEKLSTINAN